MGFVNLKISYGEAASLFALTIGYLTPRYSSLFRCELCVKVTTGPDIAESIISRMYRQPLQLSEVKHVPKCVTAAVHSTVTVIHGSGM